MKFLALAALTASLCLGSQANFRKSSATNQANGGRKVLPRLVAKSIQRGLPVIHVYRKSGVVVRECFVLEPKKRRSYSFSPDGSSMIVPKKSSSTSSDEDDDGSVDDVPSSASGEVRDMEIQIGSAGFSEAAHDPSKSESSTVDVEEAIDGSQTAQENGESPTQPEEKEPVVEIQKDAEEEDNEVVVITDHPFLDVVMGMVLSGADPVPSLMMAEVVEWLGEQTTEAAAEEQAAVAMVEEDEEDIQAPAAFQEEQDVFEPYVAHIVAEIVQPGRPQTKATAGRGGRKRVSTGRGGNKKRAEEDWEWKPSKKVAELIVHAQESTEGVQTRASVRRSMGE